MSQELDDFGTVAKERYKTLLVDYNAKVEKAKAVESIEDFAENFMETDDSVADLNAKVEKLESAIEALLSERLSIVTPLIQPAYEAAVANSGVDVTALDEQLKLLKTTSKYLTSVYGDAVLEDTDPVAKRKGKSGGGSGTGGRRIRGFLLYIDGKLAGEENKEGVVKSTFSIAAKQLGTETVTLQKAFFEAAGSEDVKQDEFPESTEFEFGDSTVMVVKGDSDES